MINFSDPNISFILFSPEKENLSSDENHSRFEKACSILYSKDYTLLNVIGHFNGTYEKSIIAFPTDNNNDLIRKDSFQILETFDQDSVIVKYNGTTKANKICNDGKEINLSVAYYDSNIENKTYLCDGLSFSFLEEKRYYYPKGKKDLSNGMIVEYYNDNVWKERVITDLETEFDLLYSLLIKYRKVRFEN
jgi:hypothetical protein